MLERMQAFFDYGEIAFHVRSNARSDGADLWYVYRVDREGGELVTGFRDAMLSAGLSTEDFDDEED